MDREARSVAVFESENVPAYSSGAFLNVLDHDVAGWQKNLEFLRTLGGIGHIEVWTEEVGLTPGEIAELRALLQGFKVILHAPYLQLSMISHHDMVRGACADIYRRTLTLADELSADLITFPGGARPFFMDDGHAIEQLAAMFGALREVGSRAKIALKNMPIASGTTVIFPATLADMRRNMERMPELMVTLDVGYCVQNKDNWIKFLRTHRHRIANIHLHDAQAEVEGHLRLGSGTMDAFALARLLRALGYTGYVSLGTVGQKDTTHSWKLWRHAQAEASQETTATLNASALRKPGDSGDDAEG